MSMFVRRIAMRRRLDLNASGRSDVRVRQNKAGEDSMRSGWSFGTAVLAAGLLHGPAAAQDWPGKPVKIVVPSAAGGSSDSITRLVANHFHQVFKQPFIIENKPGAGNALG